MSWRDRLPHPIRLMLVNIRTGIVRAVAGVVLAVLRSLPKRLQVGIRERWQIIVPLDYRAHSIGLSLESSVEFAVRRLSCAKEPETIEWIESHINAGDVVYDIGANVGAYSLVIGSRFPGRVRVYAFEPVFANYSQLVRNVLLNDLSSTVTPLPLALSDRTNIAVFDLRSASAGEASHIFDATRDASGVVRHEVLAMEADRVVDLFGLPLPNHIKLDTDGAEMLVLRGSSRILSSAQLRTVILEGSERVDSTIQLLEANGFKVASSRKHGRGAADAVMYLMVRALSENGNAQASGKSIHVSSEAATPPLPGR